MAGPGFGLGLGRALVQSAGWSPRALAPLFWAGGFAPGPERLWQESIGPFVSAPGQRVGLALDAARAAAAPIGPASLSEIAAGYNGALSFAGDALSIEAVASGANGAWAQYGFATEIGQSYLVEFEVLSRSGSSYARIVTQPATPWSFLSALSMSRTGAHSLIFTATAGTSWLLLGKVTSGQLSVRALRVRALAAPHAAQPLIAQRPLLIRHPRGGRRNLLPVSRLTAPLWAAAGGASVSARARF